MPREVGPASEAAPLAKRPPVFLMVQTECHVCGRAIEDPLTLETWGRYCSPRCFHARGLPVVFEMGG